MNTVRSCFAAIVSFLVFTIGWWAADGVVCCNSSSVASGSGVASCQNENRTFHLVEAIDSGTCDDNRTAVPVRKCCPPGQSYDPEVRFCGPAGADGDEYLRRMMQRLRNGFRAMADAVMVGYNYEQPLCDPAYVLADVPAVEVRGLMEADPSAVELPPGYCFDLTPSDELVARTCRPRDQYCGRGRYTCVNKCCKRDRMIVDGANGRKCKQSEKPFTMSAYETNLDGRPVGQSNSTVLPYYLQLKCFDRDRVDDGFMLTTDGSLYLNGDGKRVPETGYCVDYYAVAGLQAAAVLQAFVCASDEPLQAMDEDTRGSWKYFVTLAGFVPSVVCLTLTLLVYAILPSLRNVHGYYVMCYVACLLVSFICLMILQWAQEAMNSNLCILSGYFTLFAFLTSFCWLNVICFDIYWMLRYNNSISRHRSISVRTIMYHIYCWGFSSIWVCTGYLFQRSQHKTLLKFAPDIGHRSCWFFEPIGYGTLIFFIIPVSVMLTANLILFSLTAIHCSRIKSELNKFKRTDDLKTQRFLVDKEKFIMSIKLFLVMGIPWSFEMISKFFKNQWIILWVILDEINALQGVMIFIIFVAKSKVIMNLQKRLRGSMYHSESTKMTTTSGLSHNGSVNKSFNDF
ncbi:probable G-protein coupled receptor Mth-like 3 [Metopolophium dirhodum]|uniref:probable G-protein coupled receptor Mth-like 3 n=1 Tax=Metopolophium dirhodum TaxID=44670 RepID=UPI002990328D|nr:probable G-protein coupled receptor Mth-like 3 [Metopolophium dirhodum]